MTTLKESLWLAEIKFKNAEKFGKEEVERVNKFLEKLKFLIKELGEDFEIPTEDDEFPAKYKDEFFGCGFWPSYSRCDVYSYSKQSWAEHLRERYEYFKINGEPGDTA